MGMKNVQSLEHTAFSEAAAISEGGWEAGQTPIYDELVLLWYMRGRAVPTLAHSGKAMIEQDLFYRY
ncbi:hypothetical protein [Streptomyces sp. NPDC059003]|uniref:hypothetical protein n=1 Tax=Streptomyces sp. NPDC059003 TaxID=3346691 RepID=UPI0036992F0F